MEIQVSVPEWVKLPHETRVELAKQFNLKKSKGAQVEFIGGITVLQSDGYTHDDLRDITIEKMQDYLKSEETDFIKLFNACVEKVDEVANTEVAVDVDPTQIIIENWINKIEALKKDAEINGMEPYLKDLIHRLFNIKKETYVPQIQVKQSNKRGRPRKTI